MISINTAHSQNRQAVDRFARVLPIIHTALGVLGEKRSIPVPEVEAVLTDAFEQTVEEILRNSPTRSWKTPLYSAERLAGRAIAKTIALEDDCSRYVVVFDSEIWTGRDLTREDFAISVAAHELTHVHIGRVRWLSGALQGVTFPSVTPNEGARSIVRIATEEIWADMSADAVLQGIASVVDDSGSRPLRSTDLGGEGFREQLGHVIHETVYPGWPRTVMTYRVGKSKLDEMWESICVTTDQVFTLLGHCEAEARIGNRTNLFDGEFENHRGVDLYLRPAWERIMAAASEHSYLNELEQFRQGEIALLDEGEASLVEMWGKLGLRVELGGERQFSIWVSDPTF